MYGCDTSRFEKVFRPTAHLHDFRDGEMKAWSMDVCRDILNRRVSCKSQNISREDEILLVDFRVTDHGAVKVRVRIAAGVFVDFLTWHCEDGQWAEDVEGIPSRVRASQRLARLIM
jgi:Putative lumazine-binding